LGLKCGFSKVRFFTKEKMTLSQAHRIEKFIRKEEGKNNVNAKENQIQKNAKGKKQR